MRRKFNLKRRMQVDPEIVKKGRNKIFTLLVLVTLVFMAYIFGAMTGASGVSSPEVVMNPPSPWIAVENQRVTLEDGSYAYLRYGWVGDIRSCPLPEDIPMWDGKNQAKWNEVRQNCWIIVEKAEEYGLDPKVLASLIMQESGGWAGAESSAGAMGLTQVMPFHECASWDPEENIDCGASILAGHTQRDGLRSGLAAYNAGQNGRDTYQRGWDFADIVLAILNQVESASRLVSQ